MAKYVNFGKFLEIEIPIKIIRLWDNEDLEIYILELSTIRTSFKPPDIVQISKKRIPL